MKKTILFCCFYLMSLAPLPAYSEPWNLPLALNEENTHIAFGVDSTWHFVEGKTAGVSGRIWLADASDPTSIRGEVHLPVAKFDTDNARRDTRMRDVLKAEKFSEVVYTISAAEFACAPGAPLGAVPVGIPPCAVRLQGNLTIHGKSRAWSIPTKLSLSQGRYALSGEATLRWSDFDVEDPSIFIAKLQQEVKVSINVNWKDR